MPEYSEKELVVVERLVVKATRTAKRVGSDRSKLAQRHNVAARERAKTKVDIFYDGFVMHPATSAFICPECKTLTADRLGHMEYHLEQDNQHYSHSRSGLIG